MKSISLNFLLKQKKTHAPTVFLMIKNLNYCELYNEQQGIYNCWPSATPSTSTHSPPPALTSPPPASPPPAASAPAPQSPWTITLLSLQIYPNWSHRNPNWFLFPNLEIELQNCINSLFIFVCMTVNQDIQVHVQMNISSIVYVERDMNVVFVTELVIWLQGVHLAAIGCTKNYQPIGVAVHSYCVESLEGLSQQCRRGRSCSEL